MFKISIVEKRGQRRLVLEGTLVRPWTAEVERAWQRAGKEFQGRRLIIDLSNVTAISSDGENTLYKLMSEGAKFSGADVFTKHLLKQLARRLGCTPATSYLSISTGCKRLSTEDGGEDVGHKKG